VFAATEMVRGRSYSLTFGNPRDVIDHSSCQGTTIISLSLESIIQSADLFGITIVTGNADICQMPPPIQSVQSDAMGEILLHFSSLQPRTPQFSNKYTSQLVSNLESISPAEQRSDKQNQTSSTMTAIRKYPQAANRPLLPLIYPPSSASLHSPIT
jgi:hypothetical protein